MGSYGRFASAARWRRLVTCVFGGMALFVALAAQSAVAAELSVRAQAVSPANPSGAVSRATALFAGGCFWCVEADFEKLPGVIEAISGYTAGRTANPGYEQVSAGATGHTEAVKVVYDPSKVSYKELVDYFWRHIDPTVKDRQFCDMGTQYRSGIYWQNDAERKVAEGSRESLLKSGLVKQIHTEIIQATAFYPAEEYHQDYYKKNPLRYSYYRHGCGRDARVQEIWGKSGASER